MNIVIGEQVDGIRFGESRAKIRLRERDQWVQSDNQNARLDRKDGLVSLLFYEGRLFSAVANDLEKIPELIFNGKALSRFGRQEVYRFFKDEFGVDMADTANGFGSSALGIFFLGKGDHGFVKVEIHKKPED